MGSVSKPCCVNGQNCYHVVTFPHIKDPQPVAYEGDFCNKCREAESNRDFEAHQRGLSGKYPRLKDVHGLEEKRRVALKRELVAQKLGKATLKPKHPDELDKPDEFDKPGRFGQAIQKIRGYWQIDHPPKQLPPESEDFLLPPCLDNPGELSDLREVWFRHPLLG